MKDFSISSAKPSQSKPKICPTKVHNVFVCRFCYEVAEDDAGL